MISTRARLAEQYQASERPILQEGIRACWDTKRLNIGADGAERWNLTTKVPLRDPQGQIIGLVGITSDITQRKQVEIDLRKFKLALDRSAAAIFMTDTAGVITYVNPAFEKIYGFTREEAIGRTPRIIKSGLIPQEQYQRFWKTLLAGQTVAGEIVNRANDGRLVPIEGSNSAILDERGNLVGFLALHNDITERKQAEQRMEETLHETERLYAAVSREDWQAYRETGSLGAGYLFDRALIRQADNVWEPEIAQALEQQALVTTQSEQRAVAVTPLSVRGEPVGALGVYADPAHPLSKEDLQADRSRVGAGGPGTGKRPFIRSDPARCRARAHDQPRHQSHPQRALSGRSAECCRSGTAPGDAGFTQPGGNPAGS